MENYSAFRLGMKQLLPAILIVQLAFWIAVIFDLPVLRQVIGFFYLTFVPGFAIFRLLDLELGAIEKTIFAVGLSIVFLMGVGLLTDLLGPVLGISQPLGLTPLMAVVTGIVILLLLVRRENHDTQAFSMHYRKLIVPGVIISAIIVSSVIGAMLVNVPPHNNNSALLLILIFISVLIGVVAFSRRLMSPAFYPFVLFAIAVALLLPVSLFSSYIHGGDIFSEYASLKLTSSNSYWNPAVSSRVYTMLSVTILPTIYSKMLGLESIWILKIVYPLIFSLVPVGLFELFRSKFSKEIAFFSVFFFASNLVFFTEIVTLARQMIGELFYILLFLTIIGNKIQIRTKWFCFFAFSFGLIVSHYAMSYIFLAFIFGLWLLGFLRKRKTLVNVGMVIMFAVVTFLWYLYTSSSSTFNDLVNMGNNIVSNFSSDFLNPQSRGTTVLQATGLHSGIGTFWHVGGTYLYYATELLIIIGLLGLLLKKRRSFFDDDYNTLAFLNMALLLACIVVPNLATSFNATRFYQVTLFFLAPLCVVGGIDILRFLTRKKVKEKYLLAIVVLAVLIPFFLFQTDFVYEVARENSVSLPLSSYRFSAFTLSDLGMLQQSEVSGANWLTRFGNVNGTVYADLWSGVVFDYASAQSTILLSLGVPAMKGSYIYLREFNVFDGIVLANYGSSGLFNVTQIMPSLNETNLIYSSHFCEIYEVPPS